MENVGRFSVLVLFFISLSKCLSLEITRLSIPNFVQNGSAESVILDCEYSFSMVEDVNLVVKWFHENDPRPLYQWIPQMNAKFYSEKYRVDRDFVLPTGSAYTKSRAIRIENPTTELSGKYKCQVESHGGADIEEDSMIVYALPTRVHLNHTTVDDNVKIFCEVDGVYPLPEVSFYYIKPGSIDEIPIEDLEMDYELINGAYELNVFKYIPEENLTSPTDNIYYFGCKVILNGTEYEKSLKVPYFPSLIAEKREGLDMALDTGLSQYSASFSFILFLFMLLYIFT